MTDKKKVTNVGLESAVLGPWRKFAQVMWEPWTLILIAVSVALFAIGQEGKAGAVNALVQILLAAASGVLGARITSRISEASGRSVLAARGTVAVRGLKLMLVQTVAFQRRVQLFLGHTAHIEGHPEVTKRNYEEVVEFCRRMQEQAGSAMENWGDVVPTADLSSLIGRITEAEDQRDVTRGQLDSALEQLQQAAGDAEEASALREQVTILQAQVAAADERVESLMEVKAASQSALAGFHRSLREISSVPSKSGKARLRPFVLHTYTSAGVAVPKQPGSDDPQVENRVTEKPESEPEK